MMRYSSISQLVVPAVLIAAIVAGCSRSGSDSTSARSRPAGVAVTPDQTPIVGTAVIRGTVHFTGNPPAASATSDLPDPNNCQAVVHPSLGIIVNANRTLKNVVIYLSNPPRPAPPAPAAAVLLDQVYCQFQPHVVALRTGQTLHVLSSDDMPHNVHFLCEANPIQNFGMLRAGDSHDVSFANPEIFTTRCDVHAWMSAVVAVFDHPYFAVSSADGSFQIDGVPAGSYTLVAWQETLPSQTVPITVTDAGTTTSDFTFAMP
jgi:plastocyanin